MGQKKGFEFTAIRRVPPGRLELPAQGLGIPCSIRLSYGGPEHPAILVSCNGHWTACNLTTFRVVVKNACALDWAALPRGVGRESLAV